MIKQQNFTHLHHNHFFFYYFNNSFPMITLQTCILTCSEAQMLEFNSKKNTGQMENCQVFRIKAEKRGKVPFLFKKTTNSKTKT